MGGYWLDEGRSFSLWTHLQKRSTRNGAISTAGVSPSIIRASSSPVAGRRAQGKALVKVERAPGLA